jgi:hypothetical protein
MQPDVLLQYEAVGKAFMTHRALVVHANRWLYSMHAHVRF